MWNKIALNTVIFVMNIFNFKYLSSDNKIRLTLLTKNYHSF